MKKLFLLIFLFFIIFKAVYAQDEEIKIKGKVVDAENSENVPFVHIINKTTNQGLTTNENGEFVISVSPSDTILFSSVGYENYNFIVNKEEKPLDQIKIILKPSTTELKPVEVFAYRNAETFKKEFLALELPEKQEKIEIPGSYDGPRKEYTPSILNPVSFVYSMFDKKAKEKMKLVEVQQETERWKQLRRKYDFIKEIAEIDDEELQEFLLFCQLDIKKIESSSDYDLAVAVNKCLPDYKSKKN